MLCIRSNGQAGLAFFGSRRKATGWPKDRHRLSTVRKVFSCKCEALGLTRADIFKPLILKNLKTIDQ